MTTTMHTSGPVDPSAENRDAAAADAAAASSDIEIGGADRCNPVLDPSDTFVHRHIGPDSAEIAQMLEAIGCESLEQLIDETVPSSIRMDRPLDLGRSRSESRLLEELRSISKQNEVFRSLIGMGYYDTITPPVIQRNILENPGWYTQYTPYQAEIAQGRLEALLNFQTMVADLTALPLANASLLDEATAAAEAMAMCHSIAGNKDRGTVFVSEQCHPQTIAVVETRLRSMGVAVEVGSLDAIDLAKGIYCGVLIQYPATDGSVADHSTLIEKIHEAGAMAVCATDLLALTLLKAPGELGADIAVGSSQRFGVPLGFGGPHAAFIATSEKHARKMPGRIVGVSRDARGNNAYRLAIQTREQHIKRERATSNICTAQVLLAIMAGMYAVYHGPEGLRRIGSRVHGFTRALAHGLKQLGHEVLSDNYFDTLHVRCKGDAAKIIDACRAQRFNLRQFADGTLGISLDERIERADVATLLACFAGTSEATANVDELFAAADAAIPPSLQRESGYLTHPVFNTHHSETEMLRYITTLQSRDLSLADSMIPLGSCTMKLNGTSEMLPVTWPEFANIHPFAPAQQTRGYAKLFNDLETWLAEITGFEAVSLQPNAGAQGEYAGLMVIRAYHEARGDNHRTVCLIPTSAHGTNPASAIIAGFEVVPVSCDKHGNIDIDDLRAKATKHADRLGAAMITYPSTHGVFEASIRDACDIVHEHGGMVYLDGANLNAQVGICRPGDYGADVCHLNLHKTFCIPHGGGGPGMGPIACNSKLRPYLPGHPVVKPDVASDDAMGPVSAAPYGSPSILPISWMYIALMGANGLRRATEVAILNANYMAKRLSDHYDIVYKGIGGRVAHEFILDFRDLVKSAGIRIDDIAKRLMDYGFHAPTMSWPVTNTLMVEPTESESKAEMDRFCDAMIAIRAEIRDIEEGTADREDNVLANAPHTIEEVAANEWSHPYTREQAAFPMPWLRAVKFWPPVSRIDNPYGDRNLMCSCPPMEEYSQPA